MDRSACVPHTLKKTRCTGTTGLQAHEIHVCGDTSVLGLVQDLCREMGDPLVVHTYRRFSQLTMESTVRCDWC